MPVGPSNRRASSAMTASLRLGTTATGHRSLVVVVVGATGQLGGACVRHLLASNRTTVLTPVASPTNTLTRGGGMPQLVNPIWAVRGLTRNITSRASQLLKQEGCEMIAGDLNDFNSLKAAFDGAYAVFFSTTFEKDIGMAGEVRQGKTVADACKAVHVQHVVYSSVAGADTKTNVPQFEAKREIETYLVSLKLRTTILRPSAFYENFNSFSMPSKGMIKMAQKPETKLQYVAVDDVGAFAVMALNDPAEYIGRDLNIAGDELDASQLVSVFSKVMQHPFVYKRAPPLVMLRLMASDLAAMVEWFDREGYRRANIPALRALRPELKTLEQWLLENEWDKKELPDESQPCKML